MFERELQQMAAISAQPVAELRALRQLARSTFPDPEIDEPFFHQIHAFPLPALTVAPTSVLIIPLVKGFAGIMNMFACDLESGEWATNISTGGSGVSLAITSGGRPLPGLQLINGPYGLIGARQPIAVRFGPAGQVEILARNLHATVPASLCVQVSGWHFNDKLGPRLDGVGPTLAGKA
jgi:hypothetical protein